MNSPHLVLYGVITFILLSSIVCIVYVSIQNHIAVKKYYKSLQVNVPNMSNEFEFDPEDFEELDFFSVPTKATSPIAEFDPKDYSIAS